MHCARKEIKRTWVKQALVMLRGQRQIRLFKYIDLILEIFLVFGREKAVAIPCSTYLGSTWLLVHATERHETRGELLNVAAIIPGVIPDVALGVSALVVLTLDVGSAKG
jgi:hypothetical protein